MINGFHHVALKCADLDASIAFYKALGATMDRSWGEGASRACMVSLGNGNDMELFAGGEAGDKPVGFAIHLAFRSSDAKADYSKALAAGAREVDPPKQCVIPSVPEPMSVIIAFCKGLDGEIIEFMQLL